MLFQQMNINEAINQKSFSSNIEKAAINLIYTHNWYRDNNQKVFASFGIKGQHYNILRILKGKHPEPSSPGEIKQVMLDKAPDLTRLLDKLVSMDLVDRHLCPENRRMMNVYITKAGIQFLQNINDKRASISQQQQTKFSEADAEQLSILLDKFRS